MKTDTFQVIVGAIFGFFILAAIVIFATFHSSSSKNLPPVTVWGTVPAVQFTRAVTAVNQTLAQHITVTYVHKTPDQFDHDLIEALADGKGPDAILLPQNLINHYRDKIFEIPYASFSLRQFQDTFVQEGQLFTTGTGVVGLPLYVDPLVMYWNRDMFSSAGIVKPPETWEEFTNLVAQLTKKDQGGTITQSALALGEFSNITNAQNILSALLLQAGTPIVARQPDGTLHSVLDQTLKTGVPAQKALSFYTQFANPAGALYSWNRALPESQKAFLAGDLAVYFGFGSEYDTLQQKNPNLNFDIAPLPQFAGATKKITFGNVDGFAILKSTKSITNTFQVVSALYSSKFVSAWLQNQPLAPARFDLLSAPANDPVLSIIYNQALISRGWIDPDASQSQQIFQDMIESVTSGQRSVGQEVQAASLELQSLIK